MTWAKPAAMDPEADQDPIDAAIRAAASPSAMAASGRLVRFIPFDPATGTSEAFAIDRDGREVRIVNGAFEAICRLPEAPADARSRINAHAAQDTG